MERSCSSHCFSHAIDLFLLLKVGYKLIETGGSAANSHLLHTCVRVCCSSLLLLISGAQMETSGLADCVSYLI